MQKALNGCFGKFLAFGYERSHPMRDLLASCFGVKSGFCCIDGLDRQVGDAVTVAAVAEVARAAKSSSSSSRIAFS
jgi:hypothetical protein